MPSEYPPEAEGITWLAPQSLIRLRHDANKLPLNQGMIRARQGGAYLSSFKGRGMEYDESRIYLPGDDIRSMDWRVTARSGVPHTKVFQEERERPVIIWLDLGASMMFGTRNAYKAVVASQAAALLAWSTNAHKDRLGGLIFSDEHHVELRPRRGKSAVLDFIGRICRHPGWGDGHPRARDMGKALLRLRQVLHPGSLVFMISDFRGLDEAGTAHIASIARHNDVLMLQVFDPVESSLPPAGSYKVSDGRHELAFNSASDAVRRRYHARFLEHRQQLQNLCRMYRLNLLHLSTTDDLLGCLQQGLGVRPTTNSQYRSGIRR